MKTLWSKAMLGWVCVLCVALAGCFEVQSLLSSLPGIGEDNATPTPTPASTSSTSDGSEVAYGPFPPGTDTSTDDDTTDDDTTDDDVDTNGEDVDTNGEDNSEPTLEPLPDDAVVETLDDGLQVYDFVVGDGDMPESRADTVVVDYAGYIQETGRQFDAGESSTFGLSGVIDGFAEGILGMRVGGMRRIIIPPDLGYGSNGNSGAGIGGEDVIVFDVTLHEIK